MPTYVYRFVDTGETIEVQQAFTDDPLTEATHPRTGDMMAVKKVFTPVGVTFKGGGFYKTDSRGSSSRSTSSSSKDGDGASSSSSTDTSSSSTSKESSTSKDSSTTSKEPASSSSAATPSPSTASSSD